MSLKRTIALFILLLPALWLSAQRKDKVYDYHHEVIQVDSFENYTVVTWYLTIDTNIHKFKGSIFVNRPPTADQSVKWGLKYPSYVWLVKVKGRDKFYVMQNRREKVDGTYEKFYSGKRPFSRDLKEYNSDVPGQLTEHRMEELIENKLDKNAQKFRTKQGLVFYFNGKKYNVQVFEFVHEEVLQIIKKKKLYDPKRKKKKKRRRW